MSTKEQRQLLDDFKEYSKKVTATKESARELLIRTKINTKTGKLKKDYRPPEKMSAESR